jgi:uncharacterized protein
MLTAIERGAPAFITELYRYPVKSCGGEKLRVAALDSRGIIFDRNWEVIRVGEDGIKMVTQRDRNMERMTLIKPTMTLSGLRLNAPGMQTLALPFINEGPKLEAEHHKKRKYPVIDEGNIAAEWFSEFLKEPVRLARMDENYKRNVDKEYSDGEVQVGLADGHPILLVTEPSIALFNIAARGMGHPPIEDASRFRPNIVASGTMPHWEDRVDQIYVGSEGPILNPVKACQRCPIPNNNQWTAEKTPYVGKVLVAYRFFEQGELIGNRPAPEKGYYFGQNLNHSGRGLLEVGDELLPV